ncbi:MAG: DEAD/DEAH box helicase, partial [Rikenellaceae bacterium]|nr:DEAD/DEAH box helicase [Rikenellaceae bacterium]
YEDTPDQQKATEALKRAMEAPVPMDRLVCGDVGFGKTELAIRASLKAAVDGKQVAVLVPTTVLSLQHYRTFTRRLSGLPVTVENLSRSKSAAQTTDILKRLKEGKIDIIIGTHKLLGAKVEFKDLGLLIIDEEQKFGVSSKEKLRKMRESIDTLTLTATPIPRTLQFSLMGARDLSIIATPPPNRQPVSTQVHVFSRELIKEAVESEIERGGQVFFVHNKIETIGRIATLIEEEVPSARIATAHGRMPAAQLERIMSDFIYGEYDVLVSTTIIESGIDIQNANTMIVNDAQNFGLGDLHQLRGRVGRSNRKASCLLLTPPEECISETARRRLRAIEEFADLGAGFNIAMQDLDIRGAGNMLGAEQSGFIADIGFETYRKILDEAMAELKAEGYGVEMQSGDAPASKELYVSDCQIELLDEAFIPDSYVSNTAEKIRLYRTIDAIDSPEEADRITSELTDRFGTPPEPVTRLLKVVTLRRKAMMLGFEKAVIKNGFFILHFVGKPGSLYYQSATFASIMSFVASQSGDNYKIKQSENRLWLSIRGVQSIEEALVTVELMERHADKPTA